MRSRPAHLRFIAAVQRRMMEHQIFEACVFAVCAGVLAAAISERLTGGAVTVGAATALIFAISYLSRRWPTASDAAKLIDSQLGWNELLQSAMASSRSHNADHLGNVVAAVADARCGDADIGSLNFGRLTATQKLAAILVLFGSAAVSIAPHGAASPKPSVDALLDSPSATVETEAVPALSPRQFVASSTAVDEPSSRRGDVETSSSKSGGSSTLGHRGETAGGSGLGASKVAGLVTASETSEATASSKAGNVVGGDGAGAMATGGARGKSGGVVVQMSDGGPTVWSGGANRDPIDGSESSRSSVPDRDRDLIRAYFER